MEKELAMNQEMSKLTAGNLSELQMSVIQKIKSVTTIDQAINGTQLIKFEKMLGGIKAIVFVADFIKDQAAYFNLSNTISNNQSFEIAEMIFQHNPYMTVEDLAMMFREAKMMKDGYEKPYGRIDGSLIFSWLNNYMERKMDRQDHLRNEEKKKLSNELYESSKDLFEFIAPMVEKTEKPKPERITHNKHLEYVRHNITSFTKKELLDLKTSFTHQNIYHPYDQIIEELETEIQSR